LGLVPENNQCNVKTLWLPLAGNKTIVYRVREV
jgi:hypothetical protein